MKNPIPEKNMRIVGEPASYLTGSPTVKPGVIDAAHPLASRCPLHGGGWVDFHPLVRCAHGPPLKSCRSGCAFQPDTRSLKAVFCVKASSFLCQGSFCLLNQQHVIKYRLLNSGISLKSTFHSCPPTASGRSKPEERSLDTYAQL